MATACDVEPYRSDTSSRVMAYLRSCAARFLVNMALNCHGDVGPALVSSYLVAEELPKQASHVKVRNVGHWMPLNDEKQHARDGSGKQPS
jgi:hypothetical protein